ncbi:MAG TPA: hypothetical protein VLC55_10370 [Burkholderiales bacterium]|nr:hypothetical protein [Burkholderiales bacterium]
MSWSTFRVRHRWQGWICSLFLPFLLLLSTAGCSTPTTYLARPLAEPTGPKLPKRVLVVPPDVNVVEISVGGVGEKDAEWSRQAAENLLAALRAQTGKGDLFELVAMPSLTQDEKDVVDAHAAMFELVAANASEHALSTQSFWKERASSLHYTVGPGLGFLARKSGADAALFISAEDAVSTGGRVVVLLATILIFGMPALAPGYSYLAAGIVDLASGDLLWHNFDWNIARRDLRKPQDAEGLLTEVFSSLPRNGRALAPGP